MKFCVLMGSPRKKGNTASLLVPFIEELEKNGSEVTYINLYEKNLKPCIACRTCQNIFDRFGCSIVDDDMQEIFDRVLESDYIILATPIYAWYCTAPMKAVLDRLAYGMNKYYGDKRGPALWAGKKFAIITTAGYRPEKAADVFEQGIIRYCKHSQLEYCGMLAYRDKGYNVKFMDDEKEEGAREFALNLLNSKVKEPIA